MTGDILRRSGPVVQVSRSAVADNLAQLAAADGAVDVRADASGHGAALVSAVATDLGRPVRCEPENVAALRDAVAGVHIASGAPLLDAQAVFGISTAAGFGRAAMRMTGVVLSVKPLRAGESVSYGYTHTASEDTRLALITGGYAQGVVRALGNRADVRLAGGRRTIVGRVAMDVCVVDIGEAEVARGDEAVFFGDTRAGEPTVAEWAAATGLDVREITAVAGDLAQREQTP